ncbi:MAG TPA: hypothetical protein VFE50_08420 [Cyclobacteriaceae bacterium]|nr:hypothetical protein [Cyclobacteriaceae bacterium]
MNIKITTIFLLLLCIVGTSQAQQLTDGLYLFLGSDDEAYAKQLLGKPATNLNADKKSAQPGRVFVSIDNIAESHRVNSNADDIESRDVNDNKMKLRTSLTKTATGKLNLKGFGVDATLDMGRVKSVDVNITDILKLVGFKNTPSLNTNSVCGTYSGGTRYSGEFLFGKSEGANFINKVYRGTGDMSILLTSTAAADVSAAFGGIDVTANGGTIKGDTVVFHVESWNIVYVQNIKADYCKKLRGQAVRK